MKMGKKLFECTLLLGTYLYLIDKEEILKQKELFVDKVMGFLTTKTEYARSIAVQEV